MKYKIPSEHVEMPPTKREVESRTKRDLERAIEALLDDEGITAGLDDSTADLIIKWAISQIEAAYESADLFSEVAKAIRDHARSVGRIGAMIANGENADRIQRRLQKLDLTIQMSDLPSDVEEAIIVLLSGFSGTGGKA